jgi:hypothetical protein
MDKRLDAFAERLALRSIGTVDVAHQVDHQAADDLLCLARLIFSHSSCARVRARHGVLLREPKNGVGI